MCMLVAQSCPSCLRPCGQAPLSMGFSKQEYWSGLPCPPPGDLPDLGVEPAFPALAGGFLTAEPPGKPVCWLGGYYPAFSVGGFQQADCWLSFSPVPRSVVTGL